MLTEKQNKPFDLLNDEVIEAWHLLLVVRTNKSFINSYNYAILLLLLLNAANKMLNGLDSSLFCVTLVRYEVSQFLFQPVSLHLIIL